MRDSQEWCQVGSPHNIRQCKFRLDRISRIMAHPKGSQSEQEGLSILSIRVRSASDRIGLEAQDSLADRRYPLRTLLIPPSNRTARPEIAAHIGIAEAILVSPLRLPYYPWYLGVYAASTDHYS
jgi:hypothetical protein